MRGAPAPDPLQELVARQNAPLVERERVDEPELGRRQLGARAVHVGLHVARIEAELLDLDLLAASRLLCAGAPPCGGGDPRRELLHRERLDEIVVGAELERVDAVVLGAAGADDDDRRADPFSARMLDHLPPVEPGQHQVEHADVRLLVAEAGEPGLAVRDADGVEAGHGQVPGHALGDDVVVLDDQHLHHLPTSCSARRSSREVKSWCRSGERTGACYKRSNERGCRTRTGAARREPGAGGRPRRRRTGDRGEPPRTAVARRRARGRALPPELLRPTPRSLVVPYSINGRSEQLVYLSQGGDLAAYEELRSGFTAAVSHELRTPLARLLSLLEQALLPGEDVVELVERARREVEQIRELIDEVLFLSELESGRASCRSARRR